jgi:hypothetical protein
MHTNRIPSFNAYKQVVAEGLAENNCTLCPHCNEPKWLGQSHTCNEVQVTYYTSVSVSSELAALKSKRK